jgi:UDP-N-acetylmuramate dehydrogenase
LRERTTLRLGGRARAEVIIEQEDDLYALPDLLKSMAATPLVLGRGSNILAMDEDLPLVLVTADFNALPRIIEERDGEKVVTVGAAQSLPGFLNWCAQDGLDGLAGLAGIPGSVGGAVAMNAGSYGCEIGDRLDAVRVFTPQGGLAWRGRSEVSMGYRHVAPVVAESLSDWFMVTDARFVLPCATAQNIKGIMQENLRKKSATQPIGAASAGCVFKNPAPGISAGKLLDEAGFKGRRIGDMMLSEVHANFLINLGAGSSEQAMALLSEAIQGVYDKFSYKLEWEVKVCV